LPNRKKIAWLLVIFTLVIGFVFYDSGRDGFYTRPSTLFAHNFTGEDKPLPYKFSLAVHKKSKRTVARSKKKKRRKKNNLFIVKLIIDKGSRSKKTYSVRVPSKSTVFTVLKTASKKHKFSLKYSKYSYGVFIEKIAGLKNNPAKSMYWLYYINGKLSNLGASSKKIKKGDRILWKYERTN